MKEQRIKPVREMLAKVPTVHIIHAYDGLRGKGVVHFTCNDDALAIILDGTEAANCQVLIQNNEWKDVTARFYYSLIVPFRNLKWLLSWFTARLVL